MSRLNRMGEGLVVPYSEEFAAAHAEFAMRNWPKNELRRDPAYNRWKYRARNGGPIEGLLLAIWEGQVVGQVGLTPVRLQGNGATFSAQWFSDFMVDPAHRLHGIGPLLLAKAVSSGVPTLADGPTAQSRPVLKAMGFREVKGPQRMHLPLAPMRVAARRLRQTTQGFRAPFISVAAAFAPIYLAWRMRRLKSHGAGATMCGWEELVDFMAEAQSKIASLHVVHDAEFLSWRSSRFGDGLSGMHGLRTAAGSYVLFGKHRLCLYVFDWAAATEQECSVLFSAARSAGRVLGADSLSVLANTSQEQHWLRSLGLFAAQPPHELYCYSPPDFPHAVDQLHCCHCDAHANL